MGYLDIGYTKVVRYVFDVTLHHIPHAPLDHGTLGDYQQVNSHAGNDRYQDKALLVQLIERLNCVLEHTHIGSPLNNRLHVNCVFYYK